MGMVERAGQLLHLEELFTDDHSQHGTVVLIEGAAATGKTSLLQAFAHRAIESGATFLGASASRAERDLPLSAISQLFRDPALSDAQARQAERLLEDGALTATATATAHGTANGTGHEFDAVVQVPAPILSRLSTILLELAERGPLVIAIDDVHHADLPSLQFLLYLSRRIGSARIFLVLTECLRPARPRALLHSDLLHLPGARRLRLRPLSVQGVAALLAEHLGPLTAHRLAPDCHRASGGNPLLVRALIDDRRTSGPARPDCLVFGDEFRQAVLTCLYRSECTTLARGLAALPESASAILLGELVQLDAESVGLTRDVLRATGLIDAGGLRHEAVRAAVLSGMRPDERTALHVRAAELLHSYGASATVVADRLMAADQARAPWAITVLRDAAEQALAEGRAEPAIGHLRLAVRECTDEDRRLAVRLELARAEWQVDPATAARHLPELVRGLREDRLPAGAAATLAAWTLWLGRVDDALKIIFETPTDPWRSPAETGPQPEIPSWWLGFAYPSVTWRDGMPDPFRPLSAVQDGARPAGAPVPTMIEIMLADTLMKGDHDQAVVAAERILADAAPAFRTPAPVAAVAALIYADEMDRAERWCDAIGQDTSRRTPLVTAFVTVLRALIHERRGELDAAARCVRESFGLLPSKGWGVFAGIPLATLINALTAAGRYEEVEQYLDTPLPDALFHSPLVLPYLDARGRYYLAINRPHAALAEFQACGELMVTWGFDVPGFVSWRTGLARARLVLGDRQEAARLASEQLGDLPDGRHRTRGATLRALAAASGGEERLGRLREAVKLLEMSGDRLELARALADLGEAYRASGEPHRARTLEQRARSLAEACGAPDVGNAVVPALADADETGGDADPDPLTELSEAERRVAALAADGYTNRQIARRLHVTMSTVEQHLTRVYRKLKISRRADLPLTLLLLPSQDSPV
ncbi:LuxR family transcriptional regulator [Actinomadura viridis]|uniref:DNA-binding CsgD family transcriptional regulator n=1 Tax=Actinomadura viridis TaxID=58110 RepID=A0A931DUU0_9ACTN|nr:LuxR family transcriptional regulator [Actinomadura viridis]MBG6094005.1 DNA-binding CsgD family transcriptional regulator [Actinomadura viridis]